MEKILRLFCVGQKGRPHLPSAEEAGLHSGLGPSLFYNGYCKYMVKKTLKSTFHEIIQVTIYAVCDADVLESKLSAKL